MNSITWFPVSGSSLTFGPGADYMLSDIDGFGPMPLQPSTTTGAFQPGTKLLDSRIGGRTLTFDVELREGQTHADMWAKREDLARAFSAITRFDGRAVETGLLRFSRDGQNDREIVAAPLSADIQPVSPTIFRASISVFAPNPWWTETSMTQRTLSAEGGLTIPEAGITIAEAGITIGEILQRAEVNNDGHVPVPLSIIVEGEIEDARVTLEETGEALQRDGTIPAGEKVRISTEFGEKEVTLIDASDVESNDFGNLNPSFADFFWLNRGLNTIVLSFTTNTSGQALVFFKKRYAGV